MPLSDPASLRAIFDSLPDAVVVADAAGTVVAANEALLRLLGHAPAQVVGRPVEVLLPAEARGRHAEYRQRYAGDPHPRPMGQGLELSALRADGSTVAVDVALGPVAGMPGHVCAVVRDATVRRADERHLRRLATEDPLTGVRNRRSAEEELLDALTVAAARGGVLSVALLDLDGLKRLNDGDGHGAGDEALVVIAQALRARLRSIDICGRFGGDEFVVGLPGAARADACRVVAELQAAIAARPLSSGARVSASVGVATFPDDGTSLAELLAAADRAMYEAKGAAGASDDRSGAPRPS